jgi:putative toxin-antitoxin system antitoxin component (TIGR02293 family)
VCVSRLEVEIHDSVDMVRLTRSGVPVGAVHRLVDAGISQKDLSLVIHRSTLRRREANREALTPEESGRWFRVAKIQALAIEVMGNEQKASKWLHKPRRIFDDLSAIEMMDTETGLKKLWGSLMPASLREVMAYQQLFGFGWYGRSAELRPLA